jgi:asparagine synthase (glutamine-hydrolysing)
MCGILGTVNLPFGNAALNTMSHRGPDDSGIESIQTEHGDVWLGHVRLAIQDLTSAGHQPMPSACGQFIIVFNGEIYNHLALRNDLVDLAWLGHSDTETLVNYISRFGIKSVEAFNGIFGFALVDIINCKIYVARDRYGVKPVYYYQDGGQFIVSSEIRPIRKLIDDEIDKRNLATFLKLRYNPSPSTLYKKIRKVRPGHVLEYDLKTGGLTASSFIRSVAIDKVASFDRSLERYGVLFEQAVQRQLLSDVEIGVLLSGGIDSALVAFYAQKHSSNRVKTFTVGFSENDDSDETADAAETARKLGTEHYHIKISDEEFEEAFERCVGIVEEPLGTTSIIPMYYLSQLVSSHGLRVVLAGQGADEPLGGYARYRGEMAYGKLPAFLFNLIKPISGLIKDESFYRAANSLGQRDTMKRWELIYSLFNDEEIKALIGTGDSQSAEFIRYFYNLLGGSRKDSTSAMMSSDIRMSLCDDLLLYTDKISMSFSIEIRVPMLDNDLVDFVETLPVSHKLNGKEGKYIHKKFAENVLPKDIVYRKKKGFKSPTERWFRGSKGEKYRELLVREGTAFSEIFDVDAVGKVFDTHLNRKRNMERQLFALISVYYWMKGNTGVVSGRGRVRTHLAG